MESLASSGALALVPPKNHAHECKNRLSLKNSRSEFFGNKNCLSVSRSNGEWKKVSALPKIEMAINKDKKAETVQMAKDKLEGCTLLAGINYKNLTVKQFQELRRRLPETSTLVVCKNKLLGKAIEGTPFESLKPAMKGMNAWLFVHSEEIPAALKPYRDLQKEFKLENNDFTGAVFEGKFYGPEEFKALESMPTRAELYSKLLGTLQMPATTVVSTLKAPARDLVFTLKAYVAKLEEEAGNSA